MKSRFFWGRYAASAPLLVTGAVLASMPVWADAQSLTCRALVSANNQLYLVAENGALISQFPTDAQYKSSVNLSPDGSKVVYISDSSSNAFTIADTTGRLMTFPVPPSSQGPFSGVEWNSPNALKVRYHIGRDNDVFQFYLVPTSFSYPLPKIGSTIAGVNCAAQADESTIACLSENKLVVNKKVLADRDPLAPSNVSSFAATTLVVGTTFATQTSPSFQIRVQNISNDVSLLVTLPDGSWSQSRVPVGSVFPVTWDEIGYGFSPVSVDSAKGQVSIKITKSNGQGGTFDPALSWSSSNYVTTVTHSAAGAQLLIVKSSGNQAPMVASLGAIDPVTSISYVTPTVLMLRTPTQFLSVPINAINGNASSLQIGAVRSLPTSMNVVLPSGVTAASVEGWACH